MTSKKNRDRNETHTPVWVPKELNRMAKIIAAFRGETMSETVARVMGPALTRELQQVTKAEAK